VQCVVVFIDVAVAAAAADVVVAANQVGCSNFNESMSP
jgi:hypothetical protein